MAEDKRHVGAPIEWTPELKELAINHILEGIMDCKSIRAIFRSQEIKLPSNRLFLKWVAEDNELSKQYAYAMEMRSDTMFDDMLDISDSVDNDLITLPDGREVVNNNVIQRDKLRVDTRKWILSRMNPKKYGDKLSTELSGEVNVTNLTPEQREKRIAELSAKLNK